jgi:hypothetical protein
VTVTRATEWLRSELAAFEADWPSRRMDAAATRILVGTWLVCCVSLWTSNYVSRDLWLYLPDAITHDDERLWRKLGWAWGVSFIYIVPGLMWGAVLGWRPADLGFRFHGVLRHAPIYAGALAVVLPFVAAVSFERSFQQTYPMCKAAGDSLGRLVAWELSYAWQFVGVEFLFRGLFLFGTARYVGGWAAVGAMVPPYLMLHFQKPAPEALGSVIAGLAMGFLALRSRSIVLGVALHVAVAWSMDLLSLGHAGRLAKLLAG